MIRSAHGSLRLEDVERVLWSSETEGSFGNRPSAYAAESWLEDEYEDMQDDDSNKYEQSSWEE